MKHQQTKFSFLELFDKGFQVEREGGFEYLISSLPTEQGYLVTNDVESVHDINVTDRVFTVTRLIDSTSSDTTPFHMDNEEINYLLEGVGIWPV